MNSAAVTGVSDVGVDVATCWSTCNESGEFNVKVAAAWNDISVSIAVSRGYRSRGGQDSRTESTKDVSQTPSL